MAGGARLWRVVLAVLLLARGAVGGFNLNNIGKTIQDVAKDPDKAKKAVESAVGDPGKAAADAVKAGSDVAQDAADIAKGAAEKLPDVSISTGGGKSSESADGPLEAATTPAPEAPLEPAKGDDKKDKGNPFSKLFGKKNIEDTLKGVTGDKVIDTISKVDPDKVVDAVSKGAEAVQDANVKDIANAVGADNAKDALDKAVDAASGVDVGDLANKAKDASVKDVIDLAGSDGGKKGIDHIKGSNLGDIKKGLDGASKGDVKKVISNPNAAVQNIGKKGHGVRGNHSGGEGDSEKSEGGGGVSVFLVLAALVLGGYMLFRHLTKPRQIGAPMLAGEDEGTMMTGHWMGANARDVIANTQGGSGNSAGFTRF